jgi:predicted nucleic acid-binding protein
MGRLMPPSSRVYFDANVIIHMVESDGTVADLLSSLVMAKESRSNRNFVTSELSVAECLVKPLRERPDLIGMYQLVLDQGVYFQIASIDSDVIWNSAELRAKSTKLKLPDAMHIATALNQDCSHFLTSDTGIGGKFERLLSRKRLLRRKEPMQIIRPDPATLTSLLAEFAV